MYSLKVPWKLSFSSVEKSETWNEDSFWKKKKKKEGYMYYSGVSTANSTLE